MTLILHRESKSRDSSRGDTGSLLESQGEISVQRGWEVELVICRWLGQVRSDWECQSEDSPVGALWDGPPPPLLSEGGTEAEGAGVFMPSSACRSRGPASGSPGLQRG